MCGIFVCVEDNDSSVMQPTVMDTISGLLNQLTFIHTRLAINGSPGAQPITDEDKTVTLVINGEIFNWKELEVELDYKCIQSDCEIIIPLYKKIHRGYVYNSSEKLRETILSLKYVEFNGNNTPAVEPSSNPL